MRTFHLRIDEIEKRVATYQPQALNQPLNQAKAPDNTDALVAVKLLENRFATIEKQASDDSLKL